MEGVDYIELIEPVTGPRAYFKSDIHSLGDLHFKQPRLIGVVWHVDIWGFNVEGTPIVAQVIEIDVPTGEEPANGGPFHWGHVLIYVARKAKKLLCPKCNKNNPV